MIDYGAPPPGGAPSPGANQDEVSVSELSGRIRRAMEDAFGFVRVRGEIGRVSRPRSGHIYLDLKDERSVLSGVIWKSAAGRLQIQPEEGLEVIAEGRITTFPGQSKYQLVVERLAPAGAGALMAMLEERKKRLAAEGLFAEERKRPLPYLPSVVGVVSSPSGAVIRDILHRLRDRFPLHVLLWPVAVQGPKCAPEVAAAVRGFDALPAEGGAVPRPDLLIVARGGGSVEDLWGFNEEEVARAVAACSIPVISAVGHETDTTLVDFVADVRAPTPTAAAEMAAPVRSELLATLASLEQRRVTAGARHVADRRDRLRDLARALPRPESLTESARQRLDHAGDRLPRGLLGLVRTLQARLGASGGRLSPALLSGRLEQGRSRAELFGERLAPALGRRLDHAEERLAALRAPERMARAMETASASRAEQLEKLGRLLTGFSYKSTLERGFVAVRGEDGVISTADALGEGARIELEFHDGRVAAETLGEGPSGRAGATQKARRRKSQKPPGGGDAPEARSNQESAATDEPEDQGQLF
ncbi:MAG: exodeoxyribonuclease VII large subunit [Pseudomonadota bacterium]